MYCCIINSSIKITCFVASSLLLFLFFLVWCCVWQKWFDWNITVHLHDRCSDWSGDTGVNCWQVKTCNTTTCILVKGVCEHDFSVKGKCKKVDVLYWSHVQSTVNFELCTLWGAVGSQSRTQESYTPPLSIFKSSRVESVKAEVELKSSWYCRVRSHKIYVI